MKFSKLLFVSTVTAAAMSMAGQAAAFAPDWTTDKDDAAGVDGSTVVIWHSGASASTGSMQKAVTDAICDLGAPVSGTGTSGDPYILDAAHSIDLLEDARSYATAPTVSTAGVARPAFWTVACTATSGISGVTAGSKIMWSKRDEGGSGVGVGPLANNTAIAFMKPSTGVGNNCPGDGTVNSAGFTINNYSRTVPIGTSFAVATVRNCINFTYKLAPPTPAVVGEASPADDAVLRAPDIGTSDIEPDKFGFSLVENNPKTDFDLNGTVETLQTFAPPGTADVATYFDATNSGPVAYLTFGIPVNIRMYQDLQRMQFPAGHPLNADCHPNGASYGNVTAAVYDGSGNATSGGIFDPRNNANLEKCMPSLTSNEIRSMFSSTAAIKNSTDFQYMSTYNDVTTVATLAATVNGATNNAVEICRRVKGSGTQAQANAILMGYPCDLNPSNTLIMSSDGQLGATTIENEGSGDLELCLNDFNNGANGTGRNATLLKRWAVGIQSLEKNAPNFTTNTFANAYRFIKIDGFAPTIANVHAGDYYDFAAQSLQYRKAAPTPAAGVYASLSTSIKDVTSLPALNKAQAFGTTGWLAIPTSTLKPDPALALNRPVSWYRRVSSSGKFNTCALPSMFNAKGGVVVNNSATVGPQNCSKFSVGGTDNNCYTNANPINVVPVE